MHRALAGVVASEHDEGRCPPDERDAAIYQEAIPPDRPLSLEAACAEEDLPKGLWSKGNEEDPAPTRLLDALANSVAFSTGQAAFDLEWVPLGRLLQADAWWETRRVARQAPEVPKSKNFLTYDCFS